MSGMCRNGCPKFAQQYGYCRTCERRMGLDNRSIFERERARVARRNERMAALRPLEPPAWPRPIVIADGIVYEVVWDGR